MFCPIAKHKTFEKHYSMIKEHGWVYLVHASLNSGYAKDIVTSIVPCHTKQWVSLEFVGCDETNTAWIGHDIRELKMHFGRPLLWALCLLHFVELPFRKLFQHLNESKWELLCISLVLKTSH